MKKRRAVVVLLCLGTAASGMASGCRSKTVLPAASPQSAEAVKAQAREAQTEQYILNRRANARKNNRGHSIH